MSPSSSLPHQDTYGRLIFNIEQFGQPALPRRGEYLQKRITAKNAPIFYTEKSHLLPCVWYGGDHAVPASIYLLDQHSTLLRFFERHAGDQQCEIFQNNVLAVTRSRLGLFYATYDEKRSQLSVAYGSMGQVLHSFAVKEKPEQAFFGRGSQDDSPEYGLLALGYKDGNWEICKPQQREPLTVPPGFSVHGVMREDLHEAALIVVEDDQRTLSLLGAHGLRRLTAASSRIVAVTGAQQYPWIAYSTSGGEISVYSLPYRKAILQFQGGRD